MTEFTITFWADSPKGLTIGDRVEVSGTAIVSAVSADVVDISSAASPQHTIGATAVDLFSDKFKVQRQ